MKKEWLVKTLALGIVVLFIGVVIAPCISAVNKERDKNNKLKDSTEIKITDDYEEIITFIKGYAVINWIERRGLFRGEVNLTWDDFSYGFINLSGFRRSANGIEYYNKLVEVGFVYAYRFIRLYTPNPFMYPIVNGIAIGNIEWNGVI
jgi:hypothetical protein